MAKIVDRPTAWNSAGADSREECHKIGSDGHWERQGILFFFCSPLRYSQFKDIPFFQSCLQAYTTQATGARRAHNWTETFAENIFNVYFCFHPKRTNVLQSKSSSSMSLIATSNHPFSCGLVPSSAIHCNRSTSVPIYCHLSFYIVTIAFTFNKLSYNQYNYYVI